MHWYGMPGYSSFHAWNAVDVAIDGHLRHGCIVNKLDDGMIVDFDRPTKAPELVKYKKIFDCSREPERRWYKNIPEDDTNGIVNGARAGEYADVEALIRVFPDRYWTWCPAKALACITRHFVVKYGVVDVHWNGRTIREILPVAQIRLPLSPTELANRRIDPMQFTVRSCQLPPNYHAAITPHLSAFFRYEYSVFENIMPTGAADDKLMYLHLNNKPPIRDEQIANFFELKRYQITAYCRCRNYQHFPRLQWICAELLIRSPVSQSTVTEVSAGIPLATELLLEVCKSLYTADRQRCRRTCQLWEALVTSHDASKDLMIWAKMTDYNSDGFRECDYEKQAGVSEDSGYEVLACLLKNVTPSTRSISIIMLNCIWTKTLAFAMSMSKRFLSGSCINAIIFRDCFFETDDTFWPYQQNTAEAYSCLATCCQRIVWKNCGLRDERSMNPYCLNMSILAVLRIPYAVMDARSVTAALLCEILEVPLRPKVRKCLPLVAEWVAEAVGRQEKRPLLFIAKIINNYQSPDPRSTVKYRQKHWTWNTLADVEVGHLTVITLYILDQCRRCPRSLMERLMELY